MLDREANQFALLGVALLQRVNEGQGGLPLGEIVPQVLAALVGTATIVEDVVDQLKRDADVAAILGKRAAQPVIGIGQDRRYVRANLGQPRRLAVDDV